MGTNSKSEEPVTFPKQNQDPITGRFLVGNTAQSGNQLPVLLRRSVQEVQQVISNYLEDCNEKQISATIPGLAYTLGFLSKNGLYDALKREPCRDGQEAIQRAVRDSIKKAKLFIEGQRVQRMVDGKGSTVGAIFDLKCNHGYQETVHVQNDNRLHITWGTEEKPIVITPETAQIED